MVTLNKYDIAEKMGVSHQAVYKWFSGKSLPTADKLMKLSRITRLAPTKLLRLMRKP